MTSRDVREFSQHSVQRLTDAAEDLRLFLSRGYGMRESLGLVGDHFRLTKRQRQFLYRAVSPPKDAQARRAKVLPIAKISGAHLLLDGYNCLIISECCLAGGIVMLSDDGVLRDIQGLFGAYRMTEHTERTLDILTEILAARQPGMVDVYLDRRMRFAQNVADKWQSRLKSAGLCGQVERVLKTDQVLHERAQSGTIVATSDRETMDVVQYVADLPRAVVAQNPKLRFLDVQNCRSPGPDCTEKE